jgi:ribonuclease HI
LTTTLSYNINEKSGCCLVYKGKQVKDISLFSNGEDTSKQDTVNRATKIISRFKDKNSSSSYIYRYPPILKGKKQEEMIRENCNADIDSEFYKSPFSINATIASMYNKGNIKPPSFSNIGEKWYLYTDASVVDSRKPSISSCILNSNREILQLFSASIGKTDNVAEAEACAGFLGMKIVQESAIENLEWYCDNEIVLRYIEDQKEEKLDSSEPARRVKHLFTAEDGFKKNSIRGSNNKLADSTAKDIRHKEVKDHFVFTAPAVENILTDAKINRILSVARKLV